MAERVIEASKLCKCFPVRGGLFSHQTAMLRAVDGVSFVLHPGKTFGIVGESGCGKTTTGNLIIGLERPTSGRVSFDGNDIQTLRGAELRAYRRSVQAVFQDPHSSLNPRMHVEEIISEPLLVQGASRRECRTRALELLEVVGLNAAHAHRFPHEFSGGQRQRIGIARALSTQPDFIVLDEPVSALDVSIRAQILNLLLDLQREFGLGYLLIAHDLAVVEYASDTIAAMYLGRIIEICDSDKIFRIAQHPYTQTLVAAVPIADAKVRLRPLDLWGEPPSALNLPSGCRFHPRCPRAVAICRELEPCLEEVSPGHWVACHLVKPLQY